MNLKKSSVFSLFVSRSSLRKPLVLQALMILFVVGHAADDNTALNGKLRLDVTRGTVYQLLQQVSETTGYLFVYDSQVINNDNVVKLPKKDYTLGEAIYAITGNKSLCIKVVDKHILLYIHEKASPKNTPHPTNDLPQICLTAAIRDRITKEAIPYVGVSVGDGSIGTVANQDGEFKLMVPDTLQMSTVKFSHIGYQSRELSVGLLQEGHLELYMEPKLIPIQEVVVRVVDPQAVLAEMARKRTQNYPRHAAYMTVFYREGINHKQRNVNITEAVFKIYKSDVLSPASADQVKLLKMRRIVDTQENDTLFPKMKSGVRSCLQLDLMKGEMEPFLCPTLNPYYKYSHVDITNWDSCTVNVIAFEPKFKGDVFYQGHLYIDAENQTLLKASFEVSPSSMKEATDMFLVKKHRNFSITAHRIAYTVTYEPLNGTYYMKHIRGDLHFKVRQRKHLFSSNLHLWFEMVNCATDTINVQGFARNERIHTDNIFSDTKFYYDKNFWGSFNTIVQEDELQKSIIRMLNKQ